MVQKLADRAIAQRPQPQLHIAADNLYFYDCIAPSVPT